MPVQLRDNRPRDARRSARPPRDVIHREATLVGTSAAIRIDTRGRARRVHAPSADDFGTSRQLVAWLKLVVCGPALQCRLIYILINRALCQRAPQHSTARHRRLYGRASTGEDFRPPGSPNRAVTPSNGGVTTQAGPTYSPMDRRAKYAVHGFSRASSAGARVRARPQHALFSSASFQNGHGRVGKYATVAVDKSSQWGLVIRATHLSSPCPRG